MQKTDLSDFRRVPAGLAALLVALSVLLAWAPAALADMTLPAGTTEIMEEAFMGNSALGDVVLPDGLLRIGRRAFARSGLRRIYIPDSVTEMDGDVFDGVSGLTCFVRAGSFAEFYCQDLGISHVVVAGLPAVITQPSDLTVQAGERAGFSVSALGGTSFQWQTRLSASSTWNNTYLSGSKTATLSFVSTESHNGRQYRCIVSDRNGAQTISDPATLTVRPVVPLVSVTGVRLDQTALRLRVGDSAVLSPSVLPEDASDKSVTYSSSRTDVATVDANGRISVVGEGVATVTVRTVDGGYTASCEVTGYTPCLTVSPTSCSGLSAAGDSREISVTANGDWTAEASASWLSVSPASGTGSQTVTVMIAKNTSAVNSRAAKVTFTSSGMKASVTFSQSAAGYVTILNRNITLAWDGAASSVPVECTGTWEAGADKSWLTAGRVNDAILQLTPQKNTGTSPRTATVTLVLATGLAQDSVQVTQYGKPYVSLAWKNGSHTLDAGGEQALLTLRGNGAWTLSSSADWLTVSQSAGGSGSAGASAPVSCDVTISAQSNPAGAAGRSATLTATCGTATATLTVTQSSSSYLEVTCGSGLNSINPYGDTLTFTVNSNVAWTVGNLPGWATASPTSGSGDGTVTVTVAKNEIAIAREGQITFAGGTASVTKTLRQLCMPHLTIDPGTVTFTHAGGTKTVMVDSSAVWIASTIDKWITLGETGITDAGSLTFTVAPYTGDSQRSGIVTIDNNHGMVNTITVVQKPVDRISVSPQGLVASCEAYTATIDLSSNGSWTASSSASWITLNTSSGSGSAQIRLSVPDNTDVVKRSGKVTFTCGEATAVYEVDQAAAPYRVSLSTTGASIGSAGGSAQTTVTANAGWSASSSASWLTLNKTSGSKGSATVTMSAAANSSFSARSAKVTFTCGDATAVFTVTQSGKAYSISLSPTRDSRGSGSGTSSVTVTSNANWTASSSASWLRPNAASGSSGATVSISFDANSSTSSRTGKVTFTCGTATAVFTLSQAGATPTPTPTPTPPPQSDINPGLTALSESNYAVAYPLNTSGNTLTYTDKTLTTRGRTDIVSTNTYISPGDRCRIIGAGRNAAGTLYALVIYPSGSTEKKAYVYLSDFTGSLSGSAGHCTWPVYNLYVKPGLHQRDYSPTSGETWRVDAGDTVYTLDHRDGYYQIMYNISGGWRVAWCTEAAYTGNPPDTPDIPDPTLPPSGSLLSPLQGTLQNTAKSATTNGIKCDFATGGSVSVYAPGNGTVTFYQVTGKDGTQYANTLVSYGNLAVWTDGTYTLRMAHFNSFEGVSLQIPSSSTKQLSASEISGGTQWRPLGSRSVSRGEKIGMSGMTGNAYGHHLHMELSKNGTYLNPLNVFTNW